MLAWLRNLLRHWLVEEQPPSPRLDCLSISSGTVVTYFITGAVGLRLIGNAAGGGRGIRLIGQEEAVDKTQFWRLWELHGGADLRWPDGEKFVPPK